MRRPGLDNDQMTAIGEFELVGREEELGRIDKFVGALSQSASAVVLRGDAGIGKTVLWRAAIDAAEQAGVKVLQTRAVEAEMPLALGAVVDLLDSAFPEIADELLEPQRRLLASALGVEAPSAATPDSTALPRAFLAYLRALAAHNSVLVAIDDVQWLDPPSQRTIAYVARRIADEPVGFLATQRGDADDALGLRDAFAHRFEEIRVGPLSLGALHHVIRKRLGVRLRRPTVARIHDASHGNPMFALEFAAETALATGPLPLPGSLEELVRDRIARLSDEVVLLLACIAASERPTSAMLEAAVEDGAALLDAALADRTVTLDADGVVRFAHPLLASAAYTAVQPGTRRRLHARLAAASEDGEQRARHLALSTVAPDTDVAQALDDAAVRARARGAPDAAAELARHAIRLTPPHDDALVERQLAAASHLADAGDVASSRAMLEELLRASLSRGPRARALLLAAGLEEDSERARVLAEEALEHAVDGASRVYSLALYSAYLAQDGHLARSEAIAREALAIAERLGDSDVLAGALANLGFVCELAGHPEPGLLQRAVELGAGGPMVRAAQRPGTSLVLLRLWAGELPEARELLEREMDAAHTWGDERLMEILRRLFVGLEWSEGNWDRAEARLHEHSEFVFDSEDRAAAVHGLWQEALLAASRGRVEEARDRAQETVRMAERHKLQLFIVIGQWVKGFLDLALDAPGDAWESLHLVPITEHPRHIWFFPDVIEAAVATGRLDEAERVLKALETQARAREHRWAKPAAARSRALVLLARGESEAALAEAEQAAAGFHAAGFPLDHGRALLVAGEALRRLGERRRAAEKLEAARQLFATLGAPLWQTRAERELRRASPRPRRSGELTNAERRVASLVARGRTNREVAAQLFTTTGTVEAHLTRIYRKLGVRSRTELARQAAEGTLDLGDLEP